MLKYMDEGKTTLGKEIDKILKAGDISISTLEKLHKLTDTYKNLCKIHVLSESEEDGEMGSSYRRGRGINAKRDSMGRYSREDGYSEEGGYMPYDDNVSYTRGGRGGRSSYNRGYSKAEAKDWMMSQLGEMMEDADPKEREALKKCMRELERD